VTHGDELGRDAQRDRTKQKVAGIRRPFAASIFGCGWGKVIVRGYSCAALFDYKRPSPRLCTYER